jgi:hypothetical protein
MAYLAYKAKAASTSRFGFLVAGTSRKSKVTGW